MLFWITLSACTAVQMEGVWMLQIETAAGETCQEAVSHNFINATSDPETSGGPDPWEVIDTGDVSDSLIFAQVSHTRSDEALLVTGGLAYPGVKVDGATWLFTWEAQTNNYYAATHNRGYSFTETLQDTASTEITLTFDGKSAAGDWTEIASGLHTWTESDAWNNDLVGIGDPGQIPASTYLVVVEPFSGVQTTAQNGALTQDCSTEPCTLSLSSSCSTTSALTAVRTGYKDEEAYDLLESYGQAAGVSE